MLNVVVVDLKRPLVATLCLFHINMVTGTGGATYKKEFGFMVRYHGIFHRCRTLDASTLCMHVLPVGNGGMGVLCHSSGDMDTSLHKQV